MIALLGVVALLLGATLYTLSKLLDAVNRVNEQLENVRYFLGQANGRGINNQEHLQRIEQHTHRAVRAQYRADDYDDGLPD